MKHHPLRDLYNGELIGIFTATKYKKEPTPTYCSIVPFNRKILKKAGAGAESIIKVHILVAIEG